MKLKKVTVEKLFNFYSYEIPFIQDKPITIIHAPNGYGKTTVLKLIKNIMDLNIIDICMVPFNEFVIEFVDDTKIVVKKDVRERMRDRAIDMQQISILVETSTGKHEFKCQMSQRKLDRIREMGFKAYLEREEIHRRRTPVDERGNSEEVRSEYRQYCKIEENLREIRDKKGVRINFIDSNRLFTTKGKSVVVDEYMTEREIYFRNRRLHDGVDYTQNVTESIIDYSNELLKKIAQNREEFSNVSETKERDFPNRLVEYVDSGENFLDASEIVYKLSDLEKKREELEKLGLVLPGKTTTLPQNKDLDDTMLKFYSLYISDTEEKLSVFDDIKKKLELLLNIINNKTQFSNKRMRIDNRKGVVFEPIESSEAEKRIIPLDKLSSGEKHDFILFYEFIFKATENSIVLIDEPEISLHVAWQMEFVNELSKICDMNGIQAVIATHSPDIVNGNNDILVSLGEL